MCWPPEVLRGHVPRIHAQDTCRGLEAKVPALECREGHAADDWYRGKVPRTRALKAHGGVALRAHAEEESGPWTCREGESSRDAQ